MKMARLLLFLKHYMFRALGVNLLSAGRIRDADLRGYFDRDVMYFKLDSKIMI